VLIAIYVVEFARPRTALVVRSALDVLNGIPSIVIGIAVFSLLVVRFHQNAFIASVALAIIMLPLVSRATQEVLALVPQSLREASQALGVSKWRTVLRVVLPTTVGGIVTGATLGVARAAGETAPILFTSTLFTNQISADPHHPVASVPFVIFTYSESPDPHQHQIAWAAAFVLIVFVLVTSLGARFLLHRAGRKLRGA
jgi:phosphate transport system permease protein